jgi:hypothetical protein
MKTTVREYTPEDHPMLMEWWKAHGWPGVAKEVLPKLGLIVEVDTKPIVAGWLYMDNSVGVCWLEWVVGNPDSRGREIIPAIAVLIDFMGKRALEMDYGVMLTGTRTSSLIRLYEKNGFEKTDEGVTHLIKILR